jgi:hypothetical protein
VNKSLAEMDNRSIEENKLSSENRGLSKNWKNAGSSIDESLEKNAEEWTKRKSIIRKDITTVVEKDVETQGDGSQNEVRSHQSSVSHPVKPEVAGKKMIKTGLFDRSNGKFATKTSLPQNILGDSSTQKSERRSALKSADFISGRSSSATIHDSDKPIGFFKNNTRKEEYNSEPEKLKSWRSSLSEMMRSKFARAEEQANNQITDEEHDPSVEKPNFDQKGLPPRRKSSIRFVRSPKTLVDADFVSRENNGASTVFEHDGDSPSSIDDEDSPDSTVHVEKVPSLATDDFMSYQAHESASKRIHWRKSRVQTNK